MGNSDKRKGRRKFLTSVVLGTTGAVAGAVNLINEPKKRKNKDDKVIYRTLGKTGIKLPVISMGVMRADNPNLVKAALANGIVHLDTAHTYQQGKNEKMLGELLKDYPRDSFVISTKIKPSGGNRKTGLYSDKTTEEDFLKKFDISMERLGLDYVDILYHHAVSKREAALFEPVLSAMKKIKASGRAKHLGISTHKNEPEVIRAAIDSGVYEVVLVAYNFKQNHIPEMNKALQEAADAGLGIVGMKNMAGGFLDKAKTKPVNAKAAFKWALQNPNVHTLIPGFTSFDQLDECVEVMHDIKMKKEEKDALLLASTEQGMYCNACSQCVPNCKKDLPIPELMRAYMYNYGYREALKAKELLVDLNVPNNPCMDCDECTVTCVKNFAVAEKIADVTRLIDVPEDFIV
ncbi:MAG: oxidoreductase [Chlorobi bacterium]|nr:oxidoreductase [Chlorobiota bacterium]